MERTFVVVMMLSSVALWADITYVPETNTIIIENFARPAPCTVSDLRATDRISGWGRVSYDTEAGVTIVNANLQIGRPNGHPSYFQIGTEDHPQETLVVNGNLEVCPGIIFGVSKPPLRNNGLLIGCPRNPKVGGTLKLGNGKVLNIGHLEGHKGGTLGGSLIIHNGAIRPASINERWSKKFSRISPKAQVVLRNATIAGFNGSIYGLIPHWPSGKKLSWLSGESFRVEDCAFADGDSVIVGKATVRGCVFRNLRQAVLDYGGLDATFERCVFQGNRHNFALRFGRGVTCIDCEIGAPEKGDAYSRYDWGEGKVVYPQFVSKRSFRVKVVDVGGRPVSGAKVASRAENPESDPAVEPEFSDRRSATAASDGLTPPRAILLTEQVKQATDKAGVTKTIDYVYTIAAEGDGKRGEITGYKPKTGDVVTIGLE